jgi:hypothetical protein
MTPHNHDDLTNQLGRALQDQADGIGHSPITLGDVKGTATKIRRRRAMAASAAVAAGVAILVPTVLTNTQLLRADDNPADPAPNPTPTRVTLGEPLDVSDLELGAAPKVDWIEGGRTLHTAEGDTVELDRAYSGVVRYDDGWLARYSDNGDQVGVLLDASGKPTGAEFSTGFGQAVSSDGDQLLYVADGDLVMHDNNTRETRTVRADAGLETRPIAVTEDTAYYNVQLADYSSDARWWRDGQETDPKPDGLYAYNDVTDDGWAVATDEVTDFGSCSVVTAPEGGQTGRTCKLALEQFSPDGSHIRADAAYQDGYASTQLTVTTRDGVGREAAVVLEYLQSGERDAGFMSATWEDDSHLLVLTTTPIPGTSDKIWQLVRLGLDGSAENAVEPVRGEELPQFWPFGVAY